MTTKTTVYLLNDAKHDSVKVIIDAISEYGLNHPDQLDFLKRLTSQLLWCQETFTVPYKGKCKP